MRHAALYPHTITITRPAHPVGVGTVGYGGAVKATETLVKARVRAGIQFRSTSRDNPARLPGDVKIPQWRIFFQLPSGAVRIGDFITDELGRRFKVSGAYWNILGYNCSVEEMVA